MKQVLIILFGVGLLSMGCGQQEQFEQNVNRSESVPQKVESSIGITQADVAQPNNIGLNEWTNMGNAWKESEDPLIIQAKKHAEQNEYSEAIELLSRAADKGNSVAMDQLSMFYMVGLGVKEDKEKAKKYLIDAIKHGNIQAQVRFVKMLYENPKTRRERAEEILQWTRTNAEKGYALPQYLLGIIYLEGEIVPQNMKKAFQWFSESANKGYPPAQYTTANFYLRGEVIPADQKTGFILVQRAAEQDYVEAKMLLGLLYYEGIGTTQNIMKGSKYLEELFLDDYPLSEPGLFYLGLSYFNGTGVQQDKQKGKKLIQKAADLNFLPAKLWLQKQN